MLAVAILLLAGVVGASVNVFWHLRRAQAKAGAERAPTKIVGEDGEDEASPKMIDDDLFDPPDAPGPLPVLNERPVRFALIDSSGRAATEKDFLGRVWVADFIYTYCSGPCPLMSSAMAELHRDYAGKPVRFASFTCDPERDTPEALREYAALQQADPKTWRFLTGPLEELRRLASEDFLQQTDAGDPLLHSTRFLLVDREGRLRGTYVGTSPKQVGRLRRHLDRLLAEEPPTRDDDADATSRPTTESRSFERGESR